MDNLIEININREYHVSQPNTSHIRKFALYIPPKDKCVPNESHYFGLEEFSYGATCINQEEGKLVLSVRQFFKNLLENNVYAYELACTPQSEIQEVSVLGYEALSYGKENVVSKDLVSNYVKLFLLNKSKRRYTKAFRYGTIIKRLYSNIRTTEMTDDEKEVFDLLSKRKISKEKIELILAHMDFDLQELDSNCVLDEIYPPVNMKYINEFLIRIYKTHLGEAV